MKSTEQTSATRVTDEAPDTLKQREIIEPAVKFNGKYRKFGVLGRVKSFGKLC